MEWTIRRQEPPGEGSGVGRRCPMKPRPALGSCSALSGSRERTDRNVTSVRISERELLGLSVRIHVWLLFEPSDALNRQVTYSDISPEEWEQRLREQNVPEHLTGHLL